MRHEGGRDFKWNIYVAWTQASAVTAALDKLPSQEGHIPKQPLAGQSPILIYQFLQPFLFLLSCHAEVSVTFWGATHHVTESNLQCLNSSLVLTN